MDSLSLSLSLFAGLDHGLEQCLSKGQRGLERELIKRLISIIDIIKFFTNRWIEMSSIDRGVVKSESESKGERAREREQGRESKGERIGERVGDAGERERCNRMVMIYYAILSCPFIISIELQNFIETIIFAYIQ